MVGIAGEDQVRRKRATATLAGDGQITDDTAITKGRALEGVVVIRGIVQREREAEGGESVVSRALSRGSTRCHGRGVRAGGI